MVPIFWTIPQGRVADEVIARSTHTISMELDAARHPTDWKARRSGAPGDRAIQSIQFAGTPSWRTNKVRR